MELTTLTQATLDGVIQGNAGATDADRGNGYERGGCALEAGDGATMTLIIQTYQHADRAVRTGDGATHDADHPDLPARRQGRANRRRCHP